MKNILLYVLTIVSAFTIFYSCQKELNPDPIPPSQGSLLKDSNDDCMPIVVGGTYNINQTLSDSNYLQVDVNITSPGTYTINTDTVNGYSFFASSVIESNGISHIKLKATGKPLIADTNHFTIKYNESFCEANIIVIDTSLKPAMFTLVGSQQSCMDDTIKGSYIKAVLLDSSAVVKIKVDVISAGSYKVATAVINGYSFSTSGIFTTTGEQWITLYGTGTPLNTQTDTININVGNSSCNFYVDVLEPVATFGEDYFPLSLNSNWIYEDFINVGNIIKDSIVDSTNINNHFYKIMNEEVTFGGPYQYFYRKSGNDYFEYAAPNKYTTFFQYKKPVYADILFLKANLATNDAWQSPEYIDTTTTGDIISLKYEFTCLNANASITVNDKAFANVYEIRMHPLIKQTSDFAYTGEEYFFYYAKGIGLIYTKKSLGTFIQKDVQINSWKVY